MTIGGGGEILLDKKPISQLVIGDGASKKDFEWKPDPAQPNPPKKGAAKPTAWSCGGGADFQKGFAYSVSVGFKDKTAPCGAVTTVAKPASVSGGIVVWTDTTNYTSVTLYIPRIKTATAATAKNNPNSWRKKIGVGEIVTCTLEGAPGGGTVDWAFSGGEGGCTLVGSGYSATFTAGDIATGVSIVATFTATVAGQTVTGSASTALTIVEPASVTATKVREGYGNMPPGMTPPLGSGFIVAGAYMELKWHLLPDDVSFSKVQTKERDCPGTDLKGRYRTAPPSPHDDSAPWVSYGDDNEAATLDQVANTKGAADYGPPPKWFGYDASQNPPVYEAGGEFKWEIPWNWKVPAIGNIKGSGKNTHHTTITEGGIMTINKLGKSTTDTGGPYGPY
jgi:hypothetical protein